MKDQIKELRIKIDGFAQLTKELDCNQDYPAMVSAGQRMRWKSDEVTDASKSLLMAKKWLGELLVVLGIDPTSDTLRGAMEGLSYEFNPINWNEPEYTHIMKVDWLRQEIIDIVQCLKSDLFVGFWQRQLDEVNRKIGEKYPRGKSDIDEMSKEMHHLLEACIEIDFECGLAIQHLTEAIFNLEFELQRINES